jgi:hypothetical protein
MASVAQSSKVLGAAVDHAVDGRGLKASALETAAWLSLVAYVRHAFSDYDELLAQGYDQDSARYFVGDDHDAEQDDERDRDLSSAAARAGSRHGRRVGRRVRQHGGTPATSRGPAMPVRPAAPELPPAATARKPPGRARGGRNARARLAPRRQTKLRSIAASTFSMVAVYWPWYAMKSHDPRIASATAVARIMIGALVRLPASARSVRHRRLQNRKPARQPFRKRCGSDFLKHRKPFSQSFRCR